MTRKGVFLGICLIFFISAWMFVLGVLVGRGTAPVHFDIEVLQNELIALKESIIKQVQEKQRADVSSIEKNQELDFYEALKDSKKDEKLTLKPPEKQITPPSPQKQTAPSRETGKKAPTSMKKKTRVGSMSTPGGAYSVQVASTKDAKAADRLIQKLSTKGYKAYKTRADIAGKGTWYRVRTGGFGSRDEAEKVNRKLSKIGYKGMVVKN